MTFNRPQLPGKVIQKMCQAGIFAFAILLGIVVIFKDIFQSEQDIESLALGIFLWLLPNCYFVTKIMHRLGHGSGRDLLNIFYRAELIKLFFSGIFFVVAIKLLSVKIPILLLAYLTSQLVFWLLLIIKAWKVHYE